MARVIGLNTIPKVDDDDSGSTYTSVTTVIEVQRPSRTREMVDDGALEDTLLTEFPGIEIAGTSSLLIYSDPGSTQDALMNTLFTNKTQCLWQFLYSDAGTETFDAILVGYEPQPIVRNEHQKARITITRRGASTFA